MHSLLQTILEACEADLQAVVDRDPACEKFSQCMLYFKGFQAIQCHRLNHWLWRNNRRVRAMMSASSGHVIIVVSVNGFLRWHLLSPLNDMTVDVQELAVLLQSRVSEVLHVDIHPAASIGRGILMDHATGIVIGETAKVGDNVSLLHQVTLGGSGTGKGVRHPHIGEYPSIWCDSTCLYFSSDVNDAWLLCAQMFKMKSV
jgi:serine O-acetyltransferase